MKALSIQQPWAWLVVNGHKNIENRDWPTKIRGRIFIHAGKKLDREAIEFIKYQYPDIRLPDSFDLGGIVGSAFIKDCVSAHTSRWFYGDFGFVLASAQVLPFRPYRGQLGFFEISDEPATATPIAKATTAE